jgi:hypothetical protein
MAPSCLKTLNSLPHGLAILIIHATFQAAIIEKPQNSYSRCGMFSWNKSILLPLSDKHDSGSFYYEERT